MMVEPITVCTNGINTSDRSVFLFSILLSDVYDFKAIYLVKVTASISLFLVYMFLFFPFFLFLFFPVSLHLYKYNLELTI